METLKFKTNINCGGCVAAVTPALNKAAGEKNWNVDTTKPEKVLTVTDKHLSATDIEQAVRSAGFTIEKIN
jgi:copper chaperone CopZ